MSFLTDLFEGNFSNLGTDIIHAPSSLINHPDELAATLGVGALVAAPFVLPELGAAFGAADLGAGVADLGAGAADLGAGLDTVALADAGSLATDTGLAADIGLGADALASDAAALAPEFGSDVVSLADSSPEFFSDIINGTSDTSAVASDATAAAADDVLPANATVSDIGGSGSSGIPSYPSASTSSSGGITGALGDALKSPWTKLALGVAPLATTLAFGQPSLPSQLNAAEANAQALASGGSALNASQNASLAQMRQNAINAARQAMFNQGIQNPDADTRWSQMVANIDSQVTAAAQTMIQQNIQNSLAGDAQLIQIAQLQMQSDTQFANMLLQSTKALGTAAGLGGGTTIKIGS